MIQEKSSFAPTGPFVDQINLLVNSPQAQQPEAVSKIIQELKMCEQASLRFSHLKNISFHLSSLISPLSQTEEGLKTVQNLCPIIEYIIDLVEETGYELGLENYIQLISEEAGLVSLLRKVSKKEENKMQNIWRRLCNSEKLVSSIVLAANESMNKFFTLLQLITNLFPIYYDEKTLDTVLINLNMLMEGFFKSQNKKLLNLPERQIKNIISFYWEIHTKLEKLTNQPDKSFYSNILLLIVDIFNQQIFQKKLLAISLLDGFLKADPPPEQMGNLNKIVNSVLDKTIHEEIIYNFPQIMSYWLQFCCDLNIAEKWFDLTQSNDKRVRYLFTDLLQKSLTYCLKKLQFPLVKMLYKLGELYGKNQNLKGQKEQLDVLKLLVKTNYEDEEKERERMKFLMIIWEKKTSSLFIELKEDLEELVKTGSSKQFTLKVFEFLQSKFMKIQNRNSLQKCEFYVVYLKWINLILKSISDFPELRLLQKEFSWKKQLVKKILCNPFSRKAQYTKNMIDFVQSILSLEENKEDQKKLTSFFLQNASQCEQSFLLWVRKKIDHPEYKHKYRELIDPIFKSPQQFANIEPESFQLFLQNLNLVFFENNRKIPQFLLELTKISKNQEVIDSALIHCIKFYLKEEDLLNSQRCEKFIDFIVKQKNMSQNMKVRLFKQMIYLSEKKIEGKSEKIFCEEASVGKNIRIKVNLVDINYRNKKQNIEFSSTDRLWNLKTKLKLEKQPNLMVKKEGRNIWRQNGKSLDELKFENNVSLEVQIGRNERRYFQIEEISRIITRIFSYELLMKIDQIFPPKYVNLRRKAEQIIEHNRWQFQALRKEQILSLFFQLRNLQIFQVLSQFNSFCEQITQKQPKQLTSFSLRWYLSQHQIVEESLNLLGNIDPIDQQCGYGFLRMLYVQKNKSFVEKILHSLINILQLKVLEFGHCILFSLQMLIIVLQDKNIYWNFISLKFHEKIFQIGCKLIADGFFEENQNEKIIFACFKIINKILLIDKVRNYEPIVQKLIPPSKQLFNCKNLLGRNDEYEPELKIMKDYCNQNYTSLQTDFSQQSFHLLQKIMQNDEKKQMPDYLLKQVSKAICQICVFSENAHSIKIMGDYLSTHNNEICKICTFTLMLGIEAKSKWVSENFFEFLISLFLNKQNQSSFIFSLIEFTIQKSEVSQQYLQKIKNQLFNRLIENKFVETEFNQSQDLQYIISLLTELLKVDKDESFITEYLRIIWINFLFANSNQPDLSSLLKAKHPKTRQIMYKSINTILQYSKQINPKSILENVKEKIQKLLKINQQPKNIDVGVGLKNISNICYLNSLVQVLRSITPFCEGLLQIQTQFPLLKNFQQLLTSLTKTEKASISPEDFIYSFDPPINPSIQQDTTQFFINFIDKLQEGDSTGSVQQVVNKLFKGQTERTMKCLKCGAIKKGKQNFLIYSVDIETNSTKLKNLDQCLRNAEQPQTIFEFFCQDCQEKQDFHKFSTLSSVPKYFFIHLKRLTFDHTTLQKIKKHSSLQFPNQMVLKEKKLKLHAVITHSGTGEGGHYYSSIATPQYNKWLTFNDSYVKELQQQEKVEIWYGQDKNGMQMNFSTNAYVLVYENTSNEFENKFDVPKPHIKTLIEKINEENLTIVEKHLLFGPNYKKNFIQFFFSLISHPLVKEPLFQVYEALARISYVTGEITTDQNYLQNPVFMNKQQNFHQLVTTVISYKKYNMDLLFHQNDKVRNFTKEFLFLVLKLTPNIDESTFYATQFVDVPKNEIQSLQGLSQYLDFMIKLLKLYYKSELFLSTFCHSQFILQLIKLFIKKMSQIKMKIQTLGINLTDKLLILINFFLSLKNEQIPCFDEYVRVFGDIRTYLLEQKNPESIEMMFFYCENRHLALQTIIGFELYQSQSFPMILIEIVQNNIQENLENWRKCGNVCQIIEFFYLDNFWKAEHHKYLYQKLFGYSFPNTSHQNKFFSIYESRYNYLSDQLQPTYFQFLVQMILYLRQCIEPPTELLKCVRRFIITICKLYTHNHTIYRYFNASLTSPLPIYKTFPSFILGQNLNLPAESIEALKKWENEAISQLFVYGGFKNLIQKRQESIGQLRIFVEDFQCWTLEVPDRTNLFDAYLDRKGMVKNKYKNDSLVSNFMRSEKNEQKDYQIGEVGDMEIQLSKDYKLDECFPYRRIRIFNDSQAQQNKVKVQIEGQAEIESNFLVYPPSLTLGLRPKQQKEVWLVKKNGYENWGSMKIKINEKELEIIEKQIFMRE